MYINDRDLQYETEEEVIRPTQKSIPHPHRSNVSPLPSKPPGDEHNARITPPKCIPYPYSNLYRHRFPSKSIQPPLPSCCFTHRSSYFAVLTPAAAACASKNPCVVGEMSVHALTYCAADVCAPLIHGAPVPSMLSNAVKLPMIVPNRVSRDLVRSV